MSILDSTKHHNKTSSSFKYVNKWVYIFTYFLNNRMISQLREFHQFLKNGDVDQLIAIFDALRANFTEFMFDNKKIGIKKNIGIFIVQA